MENASTINTVGMVRVTMVKLSRPAHRNAQNNVEMVYVVQWKPVIIVLVIVENVFKCLGVEMICVMEMKIVAHALVIVVRVLQPSIVATISVTMEKIVIHVGLIVQSAPQCVVMGSVMELKIVCLVLGIVGHALLW